MGMYLGMYGRRNIKHTMIPWVICKLGVKMFIFGQKLISQKVLGQLVWNLARCFWNCYSADFLKNILTKLALATMTTPFSNNQMAVYFGQITTSSGKQVSKHSKNVCKYPSNHDHAHSNSQTVVYFTKITTGFNR